VVEILEWPLEQAIDEIKKGTIRDAKTMVGLQMVFYRGRVELLQEPFSPVNLVLDSFPLFSLRVIVEYSI